MANPGRNNHPLLQRWGNNGAGSFLEVNSLAEDLRLLEGVRGLQAVVSDLRHAQRCQPAWHVIHSAALFARSGTAVISQFFPQTHETLPDFAITHEETEVAVEAKLLLRSDVEIEFGKYASTLQEDLFARVLNEGVNPSVSIILKDPHNVPPIPSLVQSIQEGVAAYRDGTMSLRTPLMNVFLGPPQLGLDAFSYCDILCPRSPKENLRVAARGKAASKQLRAYTQDGRAGLFMLGLTDRQDPHELRSMFSQRFARGEYPGISGVLLIQTGTHLARPSRTVVDLLGSIRNPGAPSSMPGTLPVATLGLRGVLFEIEPHTSAIPAYRHATAQVKLPANPRDGTGLFIPEASRLTPEMLE